MSKFYITFKEKLFLSSRYKMRSCSSGEFHEVNITLMPKLDKNDMIREN